jgi:adenylylsulfate kinase
MSHIVKHHYAVTRDDRARLHGHKPLIVWFTGLSGSGKSTVAGRVEETLHAEGISTYLLDGDNIRHGLNRDIDFSPAGREENIRRIGEVAKLFVDAGTVVLAAFISPFRTDRDRVRALVEPGSYVEVFVNCPLEACEKRDVKGLYKKARAGEIPDFTGIGSPFEAPLKPEIEIRTDLLSVDEAAEKVVAYLMERIK